MENLTTEEVLENVKKNIVASIEAAKVEEAEKAERLKNEPVSDGVMDYIERHKPGFKDITNSGKMDAKPEVQKVNSLEGKKLI